MVGIYNKYWSVEDVVLLKFWYPNITNSEIGLRLNKSESAIIGKANKLGLKKDKDFIIECSKKSQFKLGHITFNKGINQSDYMSEEAIERTRATRFKKGNIPPQTCSDDDIIRIRLDKTGIPYIYIRVSLANWQPLHRVNWIENFGPIAKDHCLWCIDGNTFNTEISNWELITRKENFRRNSSATLLKDRYVANCIAWRDEDLKAELLKHPELLEIKRQQILLNRTIYDNATN